MRLKVKGKLDRIDMRYKAAAVHNQKRKVISRMAEAKMVEAVIHSPESEAP
jgi:hypothetical protein